MAWNILTESGHIVKRQDVWAVTPDEQKHPDFIKALAEFDEKVKSKIGDELKDKQVDPDLADEDPLPDWDVLFDDSEVTEPMEPDKAAEDPDGFTPEEYDQYISDEVMLPQDGEMKLARVTNRRRDGNGNPIGTRSENPLLDTREYDVEFPNKEVKTFAANVIAENIYSQVDQEGRSYAMLDEIVGHRQNKDALSKEDVTKKNRITAKGWDINVKWRDGTTAWIPLKDLKDSNPVELAECAVTAKIAEEPAFAWWVRDTLR